MEMDLRHVDLSVSNLSFYLKDLVQWETFGIQLTGIEYSDIEKITKDKSTTEEQKVALYSKWLSVYPNATWNDVVSALEKHQDLSLAEKIKKLTKDQEVVSIGKPLQHMKHISLSELEDTEEYIIDKLEQFNSTFKRILIKAYEEIEDLVEIKNHPLHRILFKLETALDDNSIQNCSSIKEVFGAIRNHTHFLDSSILKQVIETVLGNSTLLQEIDEHIKKVRKFKSSTPVKALKDKLKANEIGKNKVSVVITLKNDWEDVHVSLVENLIRNILRLKGEINWLTIESGSIQVRLAIPEKYKSEAIHSCFQKMKFIRLLGIIFIKIGVHTIRVHDEQDDATKTNYSFETAILEASKVGNLEAVQVILEIGIDVDCTNTDQGRTPLMIASADGHRNIVDHLLAHGADVNKQDNDGLTAVMVAKTVAIYEKLVQCKYNTDIVTNKGSTPLMVSCLFGNHEVANHLLFTLNHKVITRPNGLTLLMAASEGGNNDIVEHLLLHGHDPNLQCDDQNTAIHLSSLSGNYTITKNLLSFNADPNTPNVNGQTPLMNASNQGHSAVVELLLQNTADPNVLNVNKRTALIQASQYNHTKVVQMLLKHGAEPNNREKDGNTAIHCSCFYGYRTVTKTLLSHNADPNIPDNQGWTPLMSASQEGHHKIVQLLLDNNVDPNTINKSNGQTALIQASIYGHSKVVDILLRNGAEPNIQDHNGDTAIHRSSLGGFLTTTETLLNHNADPNMHDNKGWTPLLSASQGGHHEIVQLLLMHKVDPNTINKTNGRTALIQASKRGHSKVVEILLRNGADLNVQTVDGDTATNLSSFGGLLTVTELLLSHKADPDIPDNKGWTPLMGASQQGHYEIVLLLLETYKVNPNIINKMNGRTALMQASQGGHSNTVNILLRNGAKPDIQDHSGNTALHMSCSNSHYKVTQILLQYKAITDIPNHNGQTARLTQKNYDKLLKKSKHNALSEYLHNEGINYVVPQ